jgi:hypothetical protein
MSVSLRTIAEPRYELEMRITDQSQIALLCKLAGIDVSFPDAMVELEIIDVDEAMTLRAFLTPIWEQCHEVFAA